MKNKRRWNRVSAFTLVEVIVAVGFCAIAVVAVAGLMAPGTRRARELADAARARALSPYVQGELEAMRDGGGSGGGGSVTRLDRLAAQVPEADAGGGTEALRFVSSREGTRLKRETGGELVEDAYFLIEIRRMPSPHAYVFGGGCLPVEIVVIWPYRIPDGTPEGRLCDRAMAMQWIGRSVVLP